MGHGSITIDTLGSLIRYGYMLHAYCLATDCRHNVQLDLPALAERYGEDLSTVHGLRHRLRCSACGGRKVQIVLALADTPSGGYGPGTPGGRYDG